MLVLHLEYDTELKLKGRLVLDRLLHGTIQPLCLLGKSLVGIENGHSLLLLSDMENQKN